jgi:hypothetical protein
MKRLILVLALATTALAGCAQLKEAYNQASTGASATEQQNPYPRSSSNIAGN